MDDPPKAPGFEALEGLLYVAAECKCFRGVIDEANDCLPLTKPLGPENKESSHLSVLWRYNKKGWMTAYL